MTWTITMTMSIFGIGLVALTEVRASVCMCIRVSVCERVCARVCVCVRAPPHLAAGALCFLNLTEFQKTLD